MNGCFFKTVVLSATLLISAIAFAGENQEQLGCMSCHQGGAIQPDKVVKEHQSQLPVKHKVAG